MIKRVLALFLVLLLSIENFAAVVSDNDGSAFITKAEFDSLKNSFQSQIDQYNTSIDSKIDGAIAAYLAGIRLTNKQLLINKYNGIELMTGQKLKDLKWTNSTTFTVNQCDRESGNYDYQRIWQKGELYLMSARRAEGATASAGVKGKLSFYDYTASDVSERRIELDRNNRIIAWGNYNVGFQLFNAQGFAYNKYGRDMTVWIPVSFNTFRGTVRRPWMWKVNNDHNCEPGVTIQETSGAKCDETLPQDASSFVMSDMVIAPLSSTKEAFLPPQPLVGDTSSWTQASGTSRSYGEKVIYYRAQDYINSTDLYNTYHVTLDNSQSEDTPLVFNNNGPRLFMDLEARWFRIKNFNEVGFKAIYDSWLLDCPIKCGMPMTDKRTFKKEESVVVNVESAESNGYLIPYVAENPSDSWNDAKSDYRIDKYKITAGEKKNIKIDIDSAGDKIVFIVWLPDTPCVLPTMEIYHQSE